jgi:hypothetical protein
MTSFFLKNTQGETDDCNRVTISDKVALYKQHKDVYLSSYYDRTKVHIVIEY